MLSSLRQYLLFINFLLALLACTYVCSQKQPNTSGKGKRLLSSANKKSSVKKPKAIPGAWSFYQERAYNGDANPMDAYLKAQRQAQADRLCYENISEKGWQLIGPTNIGGRITDLSMHPSDTMRIYAASASGGVFKSVNQGQSWQPIFDNQYSLSIGAIAMAASNKNIIYVGTGEANAGGGSITYDGTGVYKTLNSGNTWQHLGLEKIGNVGRIVVHPENSDIAFVAAMGQLFDNNPHRGVYKTTDGGISWQKTLFVSDSTGCIDIAINPAYPDTVFAATWQRTRNLKERRYGGAECGIWRSTDGGNTWQIVNKGLPANNKGRIGLAIAPSAPNVVYAIYADEVGYFKGIYRSNNGGDSWYQLNDQLLKNMYLAYGWWFGKIVVHPEDADQLFALGIHTYFTNDGGNTWYVFDQNRIHEDQHALIVHPLKPDMYILGNDGGIYLSKNAGNSWQHVKDLPITQFYTGTIDVNEPNIIYGGTQDNGILKGNTTIINQWKKLINGDGFTVIVDSLNTESVFVAHQYGNLARLLTRDQTLIDATYGIPTVEQRSWQTPIVRHPSKVNEWYYGTNKLYQSTNNATTWEVKTDNLSKQTVQPIINDYSIYYGTISCITIPTKMANTIYIGTDDGNVWQYKTDNNELFNISTTLPNRWVTQIAVHPQNNNKIYVSFSGYKHAEYTPHIYSSNNQGDTWTDISGNLPQAPINDVIVQKDKIIVATDVGVYVSKNEGKEWLMLGNMLPNVPVTDLDYHVATNKLLAATYGRSMYEYVFKTIE